MAGCIILAVDEWKSVTHLKAQNAVMHGPAHTLYGVLRERKLPQPLAEPNHWNPYFYCLHDAFKIEIALSKAEASIKRLVNIKVWRYFDVYSVELNV